MPVLVDETGIDAAYSCSQKGLGAPPGLAPVTMSALAMERIRRRKAPPSTWYLDFLLLSDYFGIAHKYHHTVPIPMFYAMREALVIIAEEGLENRWERHCRNHLAFVMGIEKLGLKMHVAAGDRIWSLNTPRVPGGIDDAKVRRRLFDEHGIEILGGFGPLLGKVFRIGLMGAGSTAENVRIMLSALQASLEAESRT